MTQPTPGPWKAEFYRVPIGDTGDYDNVTHIRGQGGYLVAFVEDGLAQEANAALIARAPELLADNERLRELLQSVWDDCECIPTHGSNHVYEISREVMERVKSELDRIKAAIGGE